MAHSSTIGSLVGALVSSISGLSDQEDVSKFKRVRDHAARSLRSHNFVRPSQFETKNTVGGLVEKFQVRGRDDLADGLARCLDELTSTQSRWTPEYLSLLLELSDDPVRGGKVAVSVPQRPPTPPLRIDWKSIIARSRQKEIWEDIDYAALSSDEDEEIVREPEEKPRRKRDGVDDEDPVDPEAYILPVDEMAHLNLFKPANQDQRDVLQPQEVPELCFIRESLSMLHGLPTALYSRVGDRNPSIQLSGPPCFFESTTVEVCHNLSQAFADLGSRINLVRRWNDSRPGIPCVAALQNESRAVIRSFDAAVTRVEQRMLSTTSDRLISAMSVLDSVQEAARLPSIYSQVVAAFQANPEPFGQLNELYDLACQCQITHPPEVFQHLAKTLHRCLEVYLRPVETWVLNGEYDDADRMSFINPETIGMGSDSPTARLWKGEYHLRTEGSGPTARPLAPKFFDRNHFLIPVISAGMAVRYLEQLRYARNGASPRHGSIELVPFDEGCDLIPFDQRVEEALHKWASEATMGSQRRLYDAVVDGHSLIRHIEGLHAVFFATDSPMFTEFSHAMMLAGRQSPSGIPSESSAKELAQIYLGQVDSVDTWRIGARFPHKKERQGLLGASKLQLQYELPWYVQNVVQPESISAFQRIFSHLLLLSFTKTALEQSQIHFRTRACTLGAPCPFCPRLASLRHRTLVFIGIIASYVMETVLTPALAEVDAGMRGCARFDALCEVYDRFARTVETRCLASERLAPIAEAVEAILGMGIEVAGLRAAHLRATDKGSGVRGRGRYIPDRDDSESDEEVLVDPRGTERGHDLGQVVTALRVEFGKKIRFVVGGLHGIGRAGDDAGWALLATRLEPLVAS